MTDVVIVVMMVVAEVELAVQFTFFLEKDFTKRILPDTRVCPFSCTSNKQFATSLDVGQPNAKLIISYHYRSHVRIRDVGFAIVFEELCQIFWDVPIILVFLSSNLGKLYMGKKYMERPFTSSKNKFKILWL